MKGSGRVEFSAHTDTLSQSKLFIIAEFLPLLISNISQNGLQNQMEI